MQAIDQGRNAARRGWNVLRRFTLSSKLSVGHRSRNGSTTASSSNNTRRSSTNNTLDSSTVELGDTTASDVPSIFIEQETSPGVVNRTAADNIHLLNPPRPKNYIPNDLPDFDSSWKCAAGCRCPLRQVITRIGLASDADNFDNLEVLKDKLHPVIMKNDNEKGSVKSEMRQLQKEDAVRFQHLLDTLADGRFDEDLFVLKCQSWSRKLARASHQLPPSLFIKPATGVSNQPVDGGTGADIYVGFVNAKTVAIKATRMFPRSTSDGERFEIYWNLGVEALTWRQASHPRILTLLGVSYDTVRDRLSLISPWMENGNIKGYLERNKGLVPFPLIQQVAEGLEYLHSRHLTHGDLKPPNILINDRGEVCLSDLGLTRGIHTTMPTDSAYGGTQRYMAPELYNGVLPLKIPELANAADTYAFGMTVYELYDGAPPFCRDGVSALNLSMVIMEQRPTRPDKPRYELTDEMWKLIEECWVTVPTNRPKVGRIVEMLDQIAQPKA